MNFDDIIDRRGHLSSKWDMMEKNYGVPADDGLAMWVADMDFRSPDCVQDAVRAKLEHGIYGYLGDYGPYTSAIAWWMENRHGWQVDPDWILTTTGLCNAVGLAVDTLTNPGDSVVLLTPVYHAFARVIRTAGRNVRECPLVNENGRYRMDFDAYESLMTGDEKILILCSPHNPGGRVWSKDELRAVGDFARRHDLLLISDEVHHDLVYPGQTHTPMPLADPGIVDRLIMLTAPSKTFNIAGTHTGQMIVSNDMLRGQLKARMSALSLGTHDFGIAMTTAAYSPEGAAWVDELVAYLDGNRKLFDDGVNAIPGVKSMPLEATYLSWVDFSGTGMSREEYKRRVNKDARIAVNYGSTFGSGGESFLRFNIGMPRAQIAEAVERLHAAFADLQ
ncbi:pyridoxal phosphate-dependent aminotransferase [Roseovarius sp. PS-C2]|uniref:MalY/PatB family protein n=1 Tax=Roseovarius sp. PS-C2 TaxID=2820814 RepID=UPI001C0CA5C8|nr:MalY/PatB family protein [Roseovarius sp. PS-C2]MBU3261665.1 pyridoxal phosphate-dependent aminotransferase [Roseovarius sp. PS-C2]